MRINEVFGDIVNWDFIPQNAINELTLYPANPIFGLNAIGGALSFQMKNGLTYHGVEGEVNGGSYGRAITSFQAGGENGNLSGYITADAISDAGWRDESPSSLRRVYADLGARGDQTEFHLTFTGADNIFNAAAPAMLSTAFSSTALAAQPLATFRRVFPSIPLVARPKPAGLPEPVWKSQLPRIGASRSNISLSTWAAGHAQQIAQSKIQMDRLSSLT